jgi:transposase
MFVIRGCRGDLIKIIWWDGQGACLFNKRLEKGRFVWPSAKEGKIALTAAQLAMHRQAVADKRYRRAVFDRTSAFARHDVERAAS